MLKSGSTPSGGSIFSVFGPGPAEAALAEVEQRRLGLEDRLAVG